MDRVIFSDINFLEREKNTIYVINYISENRIGTNFDMANKEVHDQRKNT